MAYYEVQIQQESNVWQANLVEEWEAMSRGEKIQYCQLNSQTIGLEWAGLWKAESPEQAIQMAKVDNVDEWDRIA